MTLLFLSIYTAAAASTADTPEPVNSAASSIFLLHPNRGSASTALELASLEASLAEIKGITVRTTQGVTPAHLHAIDEELGSLIIHAGEPLWGELCTRHCVAVEGSGAAIAEQVATQLHRAIGPVWSLPTEPKTLTKTRRSAAEVYGWIRATYKRHRGSKWDPVAEAPRMEGHVPLSDWLQGRRDLSVGRLRHGADAMGRAAKARKTDRSRYDAASALLLAGWLDEAWELVRTPGVDVRTELIRGAIAHARGRTDVVDEITSRMPDHPEVRSLLLQVSADPTSSLTDWRQTFPSDLRGWRRAVDAAIRTADANQLSALLSEPISPFPPTLAEELTTFGTTLSKLHPLLDRAEVLERATARFQNEYTAARTHGPVECSNPAIGLIPQTEVYGSAHRDAVEESRELYASATRIADARPDAIGASLSDELALLRERFSKQLRAAKVLQAFQQRLILPRSLACHPSLTPSPGLGRSDHTLVKRGSPGVLCDHHGALPDIAITTGPVCLADDASCGCTPKDVLFGAVL